MLEIGDILTIVPGVPKHQRMSTKSVIAPKWGVELIGYFIRNNKDSVILYIFGKLMPFLLKSITQRNTMIKIKLMNRSKI
jgi:hypothetical protein